MQVKRNEPTRPITPSSSFDQSTYRLGVVGVTGMVTGRIMTVVTPNPTPAYSAAWMDRPVWYVAQLAESLNIERFNIVYLRPAIKYEATAYVAPESPKYIIEQRDAWFSQVMETTDVLVAAWGTTGLYKGSGFKFIRQYDQYKYFCVDTLGNGQPCTVGANAKNCGLQVYHRAASKEPRS